MILDLQREHPYSQRAREEGPGRLCEVVLCASKMLWVWEG